MLEQQRDGRRLVTVVRVPSILRETGVTACKFWRVRKALYGLASAPKSWSNYRDKVIAELEIPCEGSVLRLSKMLEDANLLHIIRLSGDGKSVNLGEGERVGLVALYVDDILIGAERPVCEAVIKALQEQWELSPPKWIAEMGDQMKFAGYELQKTSEGIRLHQEGYVQDLLEQNEETVTGIERIPAVKMSSFDDPVDEAERRELTKRSQCLIGQLLWLAGRTRPDLFYGVSMAAQKIVSSPREALARAEHLVRYLRGSPGISLHYKAADGSCGRWNQLRHQQTGHTLDVYTDASFAADEQCRSFGSVQLYWGGALVSWSAARQTLIAAHTAECELYSLSEGHLMGKAFLPTVAALMNTDVQSMQCHLYCDNMAAVQLCTLEAGSWRTRHLRLRGAIIRQDLDKEEWTLAHIDGVFMPADLGTKPVGPARLEDLLRLCDLWTPHLEPNDNPPRPSVAMVQSSPSGFTSTLLALLMLVQVSGARAQEHTLDRSMWETFVFGFGLGFGLGCGIWAATKVGQCLDVGLEELRRIVRTSRSWFRVCLRGRRLQPEEPEASGSQAPIVNEAAGVLIPLNNGTLVPLEEATYDDIRDAYYADLRNAFVQAGETEDMPEVLRENAELRRLREGLGSPRAPTVARPPGYPEVEDGRLVVRLEQPVYQVGPAGDVFEGQSSDDESEESSPTAGSTASGARQLPETGSDATSCSRGDSVASYQGSVSRIAGLSVALIPHAQGATAAEEMSSEGSWELWFILGLVVVVSIGVGVLGAWCVGGCLSRNVVVPVNQKPVNSDNGGEAGDQVRTPVNRATSRPPHVSPVINITVTGGVFEERASKGVDVQVTETVSGQGPLASTAGPQTPGSRGLGPGSTLRRRRGFDEGSGIPDSRGSGSDRPCAAHEPVRIESDNANARILGNRGVGPFRSRDLQAPVTGGQKSQCSNPKL